MSTAMPKSTALASPLGPAPAPVVGSGTGRESPVKMPTAPTGAISYAQAWKVFLAHPNAWLLITTLLVVLVGRILVGSVSAWVLVIVAAVIAGQPFQEGLIHVYVLHWKPRKLGPFVLDFEPAKRHRHHHIDPWDLPMVFISHGTLWFAVMVHMVLWLSVMPSLASLSLSAMSSVTTMGLFYEFHHYVIHTTYKPKTQFFKRMTKRHRLHQFKNEHYWHGVTLSQGDALMGTLPRHQRDVLTSPTARDLGGVAAGDCDL